MELFVEKMKIDWFSKDTNFWNERKDRTINQNYKGMINASQIKQISCKLRKGWETEH